MSWSNAWFTGNDWQVGADIVRRALSYPMKLIAKNAGVNGSVVIEKVCRQFRLHCLQKLKTHYVLSVYGYIYFLKLKIVYPWARIFSWCYILYLGVVQWQSKIWLQCCNWKIRGFDGCWYNWSHESKFFLDGALTCSCKLCNLWNSNFKPIYSTPDPLIIGLVVG